MAAPTLVDSGAPAHGTTDASNNFTFAVTLTAGVDIFVVFAGWVDSTSQTVSGVTYNGSAMTAVPSSGVLNDATAVSRGHMGCQMWYMVSPPTGSAYNVVITMNGGQPTRMIPGYGSFDGVDTSTPFGTAVTGTDEATGTSFSLVPSTTTDELAIGTMVASSNNATDITPSGTQIFEVNEQSSFGTGNCGQYVAHSSGSSTTLTWTKGATRQAAGCAVALKPAGAASTDYEATGDLDAQSAAVSGSGTVGRTSTGALAAQSAAVAGSVTISRAATGSLEAQGASVSGAATTTASQTTPQRAKSGKKYQIREEDLEKLLGILKEEEKAEKVDRKELKILVKRLESVPDITGTLYQKLETRVERVEARLDNRLERIALLMAAIEAKMAEDDEEEEELLLLS